MNALDHLLQVIRYLVGDAPFNELIQFRKGEFVLTQVSYELMSAVSNQGATGSASFTTIFLRELQRISYNMKYVSEQDLFSITEHILPTESSRRRGTLTQWGWGAVLVLVSCVSRRKSRR